MGFFSDIVDGASSLFSPSEPELPLGLIDDRETELPLGLIDDRPADLPLGLIDPLDAAAAFPHYMEDEGDALPTGMLSEEEIAAINGNLTGASPEIKAPATAAEPAPTTDPQAALEASLAIVNDAVTTAKADEIAKLAGQQEDGFAMLGIGDNQDKIADSLSNLPPEMRASVVAKLSARTGDDALSEDQLYDVNKANVAVAADEKAAEDRAKKVTNSVDAVEKAAAAGDPKAVEKSLDGLSETQREEAIEKMSPDAAKAAEEALETRRERLELVAERLEAAQHGDGALDGTDEVAVLANLSGLSPAEAEELQDIYGEKYKDDDGKSRSLKSDLKDEFDEDDKETKFIAATLDGDEDAADIGVDLAVEYLDDEAGATLNTDEETMNKLMRAYGKDPAAAERLATAYKEKTGNDLDTDCQDVMNDEEYKEAAAYQRGDMTTANVAIVEQGDGERTEEMLDDARLEKDGIANLTTEYQAQTGQELDVALKDQVSPEAATAVEADVKLAKDEAKTKRDALYQAEYDKLAQDPKALAEANAKAESAASKLSTAMSQMHLPGNNTAVTEALRGLGPAEMKLAMEHYAEMTRTAGGEARDLEADLRENLSGKDLKVANAVMSGDKVLSAVAYVEQAADNAGTNVEDWKKSMETLKTPAEREQFLALMEKHRGGKDAYERLAKSETSSFDRDEVLASAIVDEDDRAATMAQVAITKNAYGGKYTQLIEGLDDEVGGMIGESDAQREKRRKEMRQHDVLMMASNAGGNEDAMTDAVGGMENERQLALLHEKMLAANGETLEDTISGEMSGHHEEAALKFAKGDYEGAQAERMVAELDNYVDDREDAASKPFENVRLSDDAKKRIAELPEQERAKALEAEQATARKSLLAKSDEAARAAGYESYMDMLGKELSPAELAIAKDRIELGKVSELHALVAAGDTTVGNLGKDSAKFYEVMQNKTPEQMDTLRADFAKEHPDLDFNEWVLGKATSSGEKRDFKIMLEGNYARMDDKDLAKMAEEDPDKLIQRVMDYEKAARGGVTDGFELGNELGNEAANMRGNAGERLDARVDAVTAMKDKLARGESLSADEQKDLISHMRYMAGDQQAFTETKTEIVDAGAEVVGKAAEYGTVALSGNDAAGAAVGALAKMQVKGTFNAGRYSTDEMVADLAQGVADTAAAGIGGKFEKNPILQGAVEGSIGALGGLGNTRAWNDGGQLVLETGTAVAEGAGSGALSAAAEAAGGDNVLGKLLSAGTDQLASGSNATLRDQLIEMGKSMAEDAASDHASEHHKKHSQAANGSHEAHDETPHEAAHDEAPHETSHEAEPIPGLPIIDVEGDPTPIDAAPEAPIPGLPIIDVGPAATKEAKERYTPDQKAALELQYEARTPEELAIANEFAREVGLPEAHDDQLERNYLVEQFRTESDPEQLAAAGELQRELDTRNPQAPGAAFADMHAQASEGGDMHPDDHGGLIDHLGQLHRDARATDLDGLTTDDGVIDNVEEEMLAPLRAMVGTDRLDFLTSMVAHGTDPAAVSALFDKLRHIDAAPGVSSGVDASGTPMPDMSSLSDEERELWIRMNADRFNDVQEGSDIAKVTPRADADKLLAGTRDSVGGFVSLGSHSDGLDAHGILQMAGLDHDWHADQGFFDPKTNVFTDIAVNVLHMSATPELLDVLQVPFMTDARTEMQSEAERLAAQTPSGTLDRTEAVPRLLQPSVDANGEPIRDADGNLVLPHVGSYDRVPATTPTGGDTNPFTGLGFSAVGRALDALGNLLPVIPNQELTVGTQGAGKKFYKVPGGAFIVDMETGKVTPVPTP